MKSLITKKLILKKVTISTHGILGANNAAPSQNESAEETYSSAFRDPTEIQQTDTRYLSQDAAICE